MLRSINKIILTKRLLLTAAASSFVALSSAATHESRCVTAGEDDEDPPPSYEAAVSSTPSAPPLRELRKSQHIDPKVHSLEIEAALKKGILNSPLFHAECKRIAEQAVKQALTSPQVRTSLSRQTEQHISRASLVQCEIVLKNPKLPFVSTH